MSKTYDEPESPNEEACLGYVLESPHEGACLRDMMPQSRQMRGRV